MSNFWGQVQTRCRWTSLLEIVRASRLFPTPNRGGISLPGIHPVSKGVRTGMHRASLRVIIRVPGGGEANKSEGGAIVDVWIHASGWSIDPEAPEMRRGGGRSFRSRRFGRVLSPGGGLRSWSLPVLEAPLFALVDLVFERSEPSFGGCGPQARARRSIGVTETIPGCCRFSRALSSRT